MIITCPINMSPSTLRKAKQDKLVQAKKKLAFKWKTRGSRGGGPTWGVLVT